MAGLARRLGQTRAGYWLWKVTRQTRAAPLVNLMARAVTALGMVWQRRRPAHCAHDAAQAATLAAFEADTAVKSRPAPRP